MTPSANLVPLPIKALTFVPTNLFDSIRGVYRAATVFRTFNCNSMAARNFHVGPDPA
jgi:hypothetical protein